MATSPPPLPPTEPPPLAYADRSLAPDPRWAAGRVIRAVIWGLIWLAAIHLTFAIVVPKFDAIFADFKMDLPGATKLLLGLGRAYTHNYGWVLLPVLVSGGVLIWLALGDPAPSRRRVPVMVTLALGLFVGWIVISLFSPMVTLINAVSSSSGKK